MKVSSKDSNPSVLAYVQHARHLNAAGGEGVSDTIHRNGNITNPADGDRVSISSRARDIRQALDIARSAPDVREEMVAAVRTRIQNGTYEINTEKIAMNMILESLFDDMPTADACDGYAR